MRCWRCNDRDETDDFGLCRACDDELRRENLIPPGKQLHARGTLPEEVGDYRAPRPSDFVTHPTGEGIWAGPNQVVTTDGIVTFVGEWRLNFENRIATIRDVFFPAT